MTDYTSEITAWYNAIQYRTPPASELTQFNAQLQNGIITTAQAIAQIEGSSYTQNYVDPVIREYQAAFGRVPDQAGVAYWVGVVAANPASLAVLSTTFADSAEFMTKYGASATTPASSTLVTALYTNVLGRGPDAAGLAYWSNSGLDAAQLLQAFAQSAEFITDTTPYVIQFQNAEVALNEPTTGSLYNQAIPGGIAANTYTITYGAPTTFSISSVLGGAPVTGTVAGGPTGPIFSTEAAGNSNVTINATLGLNNSQSIVFTGINNVLNADYTPGVGLSSLTSSTFPGSNFDQVGLNIRGVQTWNIQAEVPVGSSSSYSTITFTGDAAAGNVISGLQTVNFNDNSGTTSLLIGDNSEPVQEPNGGANGFTINVSNAIGTGTNFVDVDIAAQSFTGKDTINVGAYIVGGFPESNGSYVIPAFETGFSGDPDNYDPNWLGFQKDAFAISSGASAGPNGSTGFQNWIVTSAGAYTVGTINILALGGEGSTSAQTLTLQNPAGDNSATILYATAASDSLSTDWENLTTITLTGTTGNVVLTGAETDAQAGGWTSYGGGLLTSDTSALVTIAGGAGNSFYDLSSLSVAAATNTKASFDGGHGTGANSEIAFSNYVVATANVTTVPGGVTLNPGLAVNISHIQVLDDTGGLILSNGTVTDDQGGTINVLDFAGLQGLNTNYDLLSGPLGNLFYVSGGSVLQDPTFAAGTDVAPKGYELLQLLDSDGSTANVLGANLSIWGGSALFAVNMMDVADGSITTPSDTKHYPTTFATDPTLDGTDHFYADYTISGGAIYVDPSVGIWALYSAPLTTLTGYDITISQGEPGSQVSTNSTLKLWLADDGVNVYEQTIKDGGKDYKSITTTTLVGTIFDAPAVTIDNYTTTDIYLPYESIPGMQNYVVLGSQLPGISNDGVGGFVVNPVVTVPVFNSVFGSVYFYDNMADTGGSPPGGPDNLVLGYTNFTADLAPVTSTANYDPEGTIGQPSVEINSAAQTAIFDYGHGSLEIGAAAITYLNAVSTSHLIMDLPAVPPGALSIDNALSGTGIVVYGSATGQNLIQGSSWYVDFDTNGHTGPAGATFGATGTTGVLLGPDGGESPINNYGVGNDILVGGVGAGLENQDHLSWVKGDNYFPEGGKDIVDISHASSSPTYDTVWVGMYDVSSIINSTGVAPHYVFGQAITDIVAGVETYVDGYGPGVTASGLSPQGTAIGASGSNTSGLVVNGFVEGNNTSSGDILNFDPQDWATSAAAGGALVKDPISHVLVTDLGLVNTDGVTETATTVGREGTVVYVGTSASDGGKIAAGGAFDVILDGLAGYQNASQLVQALSSPDGGDIGFGTGIAGKTTEHLLIAYNNTLTGGVTIDDVTITNTNKGLAFSTSASGVEISAVDVVQLDGGASNPVATVGSLLHNIYFLHG
jgi:hypothetical protein